MTPTRHPLADRYGWAGTPQEFYWLCPGECGRSFLFDPNPGYEECPDCRPFVGPPSHLRPLPPAPARTQHVMTEAEWHKVYDSVKASRMAFDGIDPQWEAPPR